MGAKPRQYSPKQQRFIAEYLVDLNATQAAIRAGYSPKVAKEMGYENLTKPHMAAAIQGAMDARAERTGITADRVLQEIARLAFVDIRKLYDEHGALKPLPDIDDDTAAAVAGLEVFEECAGRGEGRVAIGQTKKVRLWDKPQSLTLLGKHLKLFVDRVQHEGEVALTLTDRARVANDRIARLRRGSQGTE